eukprot:4873192-Pyramimonas_sp.AAC.1
MVPLSPSGGSSSSSPMMTSRLVLGGPRQPPALAVGPPAEASEVLDMLAPVRVASPREPGRP